MHATDNLRDDLFSGRIVYILATKKVKYLEAFCCLNMDYLYMYTTFNTFY